MYTGRKVDEADWLQTKSGYTNWNWKERSMNSENQSIFRAFLLFDLQPIMYKSAIIF